MKHITILFLLISVLGQAQNEKKTLLLNGFLHTGNGEVLESAAIGIQGSKIILLRNSLSYSYKREDWDTIIDIYGQHIYPGFIAANSQLGLEEFESIRATRDYSEIGLFNPHVRAQIAYNVESNVISTVLTNGVLITQATPTAGRISGTSSMMATSGWNWEDATILKDDGIHVNWPEALEYEPVKKNVNYDQQKSELSTFFQLAKTYAETDKNEAIDQRLEAMKACFTGNKRVYFHANQLQELLDVIDFSKKNGIRFPVIVGGYDSYLATLQLKEAKIPVMLSRTHSLPERDDDPIDLPFRLPYLLQQAGVLFCIQNEGDMQPTNARNLPFQAGTAMAYGLSEEEAIAAISWNVCRITGIDQQYGTVEEGKNATFFVSAGNALEMTQNHTTLIFIDGKLLPVTNFQDELYKKYSEKGAQ